MYSNICQSRSNWCHKFCRKYSTVKQHGAVPLQEKNPVPFPLFPAVQQLSPELTQVLIPEVQVTH